MENYRGEKLRYKKNVFEPTSDKRFMAYNFQSNNYIFCRPEPKKDQITGQARIEIMDLIKELDKDVEIR